MVGNGFQALTAETLAAKDAALREVGALMKEARRIANGIELDFARLAALFAALQDPLDLTADDNPVQFMREESRMTSHAARTALNVGEFEAQLEGSIAAVTDGEIGMAHLGWMADTAQRLATAECADPFDENRLLESAKRLSVQRFRRECRHLVHAADHAGFVADQVRDVEARTLRMTTLEDGALHLDGYFDAEGGAIVRAALDPLARRGGADDHRELRQRRADALVEMCNHILDSGVASRIGGARPHIHVTTTLETLLDFSGAPAAETESGALLSGAATARLACDSTLIRVLLDADSKVIDVGRAARVVPPSTRRALAVRDRGCRWPGCERTASWTQAHHLVHWSVGGRTDVDNLVLLCRRHHWMVHEGGWVVVKGPDGELLTLAPGARQYHHGRDPTVAIA